MTTAILLVLAGVSSRLLPHPPNAVALGAIALYAGARLPRRWALTIPLAILLISDYALDYAHGHPFYFASRLTTYLLFTLIAWGGTFVARDASPMARCGFSVLASTTFFLLSNLAVWFEGTGYDFPRTFAGLMSTYAVAIPFYQNSLVADLIGTGLLFGLDSLLNRIFETARSPRQEAA
ncbi:MAG: DUF6580 family putative transport protein [Isosphaeraceae bacterium]